MMDGEDEGDACGTIIPGFGILHSLALRRTPFAGEKRNAEKIL